MTISVALAALLAAVAGFQEPVLHEARVVLRTSEGDLVLVLYPQVAPRHVAHFLRLVRSGYYDGTRFGVVMRKYLVQHAGTTDRLRSLTPEQLRLASWRLHAEFGRLPHVRGVLSMSRQPDDLDSATTSFSILFGPAPHLDGNYTIFGRVEKGLDVLAAMEDVEVGPKNVPKLPLNLHRAFVEGEETAQPTDFGPPVGLVVVAGVMMVLGLAAFLLSGRVLPRYAGPVGLSIVIVGFFIGFVAGFPRVVESKDHREYLALAVFIAMLGLFRLMGKYESPKP
ncbi:MAG TPA: peptidylprolyl isomerase [Planctomycetota bacterium]|nr:peptidylprolyl isomerase [Planctomycetota bacterium]